MSELDDKLQQLAKDRVESFQHDAYQPNSTWNIQADLMLFAAEVRRLTVEECLELAELRAEAAIIGKKLHNLNANYVKGIQDGSVQIAEAIRALLPQVRAEEKP